MSIARALKAVAVFGLGAAIATKEEQRLEHDDASALVQLSVASLEGLESGDWGAPITKGRARKNRTMDFTLTQEQNGILGHFLGSASFTVDVMGWHVHGYDIAMYLSENSSLWSSSKTLSREELMDQMLGDSFFETIAHSKWVNNKNLAKFVDRLEFFAKKAKISDYQGPLATYKQVYLDAPKVTRGSHIVLCPSKEGIRPIVTGKDMGLTKSDFIGHLIMQAYLGEDSDLPEFRDHVFSQLAVGKPEQVGQPAEVHAQAGNSTWGIIILVIIIAAVVGCFCACLWYCCRKKVDDEEQK